LYQIVERRLSQFRGWIYLQFQHNTQRSAKIDWRTKAVIVANPPTDRFGSRPNENQIRSRANEANPLRLLFLGNVIPLKGLHVLLEALRHPAFDFRLDVVGSLTVDPTLCS